MYIFNWFKTPISLISKETIPALYVRRISVGNTSFLENTQIELEQNPGRGEHSLDVCLAYMNSDAYNLTYGDKPVWHTYIRKFKGAYPPETRKNCFRNGKLSTGSPCPICRDQYLLPHYRNIKLLKQFISPLGGHVLETMKTGVCQRQQFNLLIAIKKAQNYGLLTFTVPHREYDYSVYIKK